LSLSNEQDNSDAYVEGAIQTYRTDRLVLPEMSRPILTKFRITVQATFQFAKDDEPLWSKSFSGAATYDVLDNPVDGEIEAAQAALQQISNNMFNDAVSSW
jgi:hypothetical protein